MKVTLALLSFTLAVSSACKKDEPAAVLPSPGQTTHAAVAVFSLEPPLDPDNIVSIALASPDHTTLVTALEAADYVNPIANPGPLTVFAPTDAAFAKLPAGTVEGLLEPGRIDDLQYVLKYHATTSVHDATTLKDGQSLAMANGAKVRIELEDGKMMVNDAHVIASIRASNGIVHVIDAVLIPPAK